MYPLWERVIAPLMDVVGPKRVVEIGALRGETTTLMLDRLGPDCELHVIDPVPQFDPAEHERRFPGRYVFHHGISHDVLPTLGPVDVALVDGDHNWFTVYHELQMLASTAREGGMALPVLILHDVGWPYGRRDLYYEPSRIPEEYRQPFRRAGMRPGRSELVPGGMNADLANADHEGGPRNGVLTGLEDFVAQHDQPIRVVVLGPYFGLAIAVERASLDANPALRALLDRWESEEGARELVRLGESIRIDEAIIAQAWLRHLDGKVDRGATRYLALTKSSLLDEQYIDNEVRLSHAMRMLTSPARASSDLSVLRDPARQLRAEHQRIQLARQEGRRLDGERVTSFFPYTDMGRTQLDHLEFAFTRILADGVPGDVAEVGVGRGGGGIFLRAFMEAHEITDRSVLMVDEFRASREVDDIGGDPLATLLRGFGADLHQVRDGFERFDLLDDRVRFLQGPPAMVLSGAAVERLALIRFGPDLGADLGGAIVACYQRLSAGAQVVVSGVSSADVERQVESARLAVAEAAPLERVDWNSVTWIVDGPGTANESRRPRPAVKRHGRRGPVDLSVVVVFHEMRREAARTLTSLTRQYQKGVDDLTYEVLVVDNGSSPGQRLTEDEVRTFGDEFLLIDMGEGARPSPTSALNAGIEASRGRNLALMIDGAHVLTPGVLHHGMLALDAYAPAVVATQQWYVGPGQQSEMLHAADTTRSRRIGSSTASTGPPTGTGCSRSVTSSASAIGSTGIVESNCLFVPRALLDQIGGFDESFLDARRWLRQPRSVRTTRPRARRQRRQHPGRGHASTSSTAAPRPTCADEGEHRARVASYGTHFTDLRGRGLLGLDRPVNFVGSTQARPGAPHSFAPAHRCGAPDFRRSRGSLVGTCPGPRARRAQARRHRGALGQQVPGVKPRGSATRCAAIRPTCTVTRRCSSPSDPTWWCWPATTRDSAVGLSCSRRSSMPAGSRTCRRHRPRARGRGTDPRPRGARRRVGRRCTSRSPSSTRKRAAAGHWCSSAWAPWSGWSRPSRTSKRSSTSAATSWSRTRS